jgi:hypothetical protein
LPAKHNADRLPELYLLCREYEATLQVTTNPEEQRRLRRILQELRACILRIENH